MARLYVGLSAFTETQYSFPQVVVLIWRFADGKIAEHWAEPDRLGLMQQLGVISPPGPASG